MESENMTKREKALEIINKEIAEIRAMKPEKYENEVSFNIRKRHYLDEAKAIKMRLYVELN